MLSDDPESARAGYGTFAVVNIILCVVFGLFILPAASFGGFQPLAIATYVALLAGTFGSFYLLAKKREIDRTACKRIAIASGVFMLLAVLPPLLFGIARMSSR